MDDSNYIIPIELLEKQSGRNAIPNDEIADLEHKLLNMFSKLGKSVDRIDSIVSPSVITIKATLSEGSEISAKRPPEATGSIRWIPHAPGRRSIAAEVPRADRKIVRLREVIESDEFRDSSAELPVALGISAENEPIVADLSKMPHLLIGGAIGSGKSVLLHSMIVSLLYRKSPDEVKFLLIDPKMVELTNYIGISNQYLVKIEGIDKDVITEPESTIIALNSLCVEMRKRY